MSVLAPQNRACTETGALCTAAGVMLSTGLGRSVPGPVAQGQQGLAPLAAGFVSVPAEHDGETEFWLELTFDAAVAQGSKSRIRALLGSHRGFGDEDAPEGRPARPLADQDSAFLARGGDGDALAVAGLRGGGCGMHGGRAHVHDRPRDANPGSSGSLGGGRGSTGRPERGLKLRGDAQPGALLYGDGGLRDRRRHGRRPGPTTRRRAATLTFAAGETEKTVSVPVLDDAHDEGSETLTLTLSNATGAYIEDGTATGTIKNTDHMPKAWLARFGRTVAEQVLDAVGARVEGNSNSPGPAQLTLGGHRVVLGASWRRGGGHLTRGGRRTRAGLEGRRGTSSGRRRTPHPRARYRRPGC